MAAKLLLPGAPRACIDPGRGLSGQWEVTTSLWRLLPLGCEAACRTRAGHGSISRIYLVSCAPSLKSILKGMAVGLPVALL